MTTLPDPQAEVPMLLALKKVLEQTGAFSSAEAKILVDYIRQLEADHKIMSNWISELARHTNDGALRTVHSRQYTADANAAYAPGKRGSAPPNWRGNEPCATLCDDSGLGQPCDVLCR